MQKKTYTLYLFILTGLLLGISWYKPFTFLIFVAWIPLFIANEKLYLKNNTLKQRFFLYAKYLLCFFIWNIVVYWWLWISVDLLSIAAALANSLLMLIPIIAFYSTRKYFQKSFQFFLFVIYWISFEYIHLHWDLSWPWLNLGNVFGIYTKYVQWYEYTGIFGGTLWILIVNSLVYKAYITRKKIYIIVFIIAIAIPIGYSYITYINYKEKGEVVELSVIQPNFDCYTQKYKANPSTDKENDTTYIPYAEQIEIMLDMAKKAITKNTRFLLLPETAFHIGINEERLKNNSYIEDYANSFSNFTNLSLVIGLISYTKTKDEKSIHVSNSALQVDNRNELEIYKKSKLVIGVESIPFEGIINFVPVDIGGVSSTLTTQPEREIFWSVDSLSSIAPIICYESVYGEYVTEYVTKGATILGVITNDGWWGNTPGHEQHFAFSKLRAIENRRTVARSANTGISGFISQNGDVMKSISYDKKGYLTYKVHSNDNLTFYTRHGDYIPRITVFLSITIILIAIVKSRLRVGM